MSIFERNQKTITTQQQRILQHTHVLILGCGGLGGHVAHALVRVGIGELTLIDNDVFELTNLNRQCFSDHTQLGLKKVQVLKEALIKINPDLIVHCVDQEIEAKDLLEFSTVDVIVDALDDFSLKTSIEALKLKVPILSGMISAWFGYVTISDPNHPNLSKMGHGFQKGTEEEWGNLAITASACAQIQSSLLIQIILYQRTIQDGFYYLDLKELTLEFIDFQ